MLRFLPVVVALSFVLLSVRSGIADDGKSIDIAPALKSAIAEKKLDKSVQFFFGTQATPAIAQNFGQFSTNKKTNGFLKGDNSACPEAFLSALITLQKRALKLGGNAIIHIESYHNGSYISSETQYKCRNGFVLAGVALRGDIVRLAGH